MAGACGALRHSQVALLHRASLCGRALDVNGALHQHELSLQRSAAPGARGADEKTERQLCLVTSQFHTISYLALVSSSTPSLDAAPLQCPDAFSPEDTVNSHRQRLKCTRGEESPWYKREI